VVVPSRKLPGWSRKEASERRRTAILISRRRSGRFPTTALDTRQDCFHDSATNGGPVCNPADVGSAKCLLKVCCRSTGLG
jgi:hypothetical protein